MAALDELCADPAVSRGRMFGHADPKFGGKFVVMELAAERARAG